MGARGRWFESSYPDMNTAEKEAIWVWRFEDAPEEYRALSRNGGDEDWLAVVPSSFKGVWIPWLEGGSPFGVCDVQIYTLESGHQVYIGSHS